MRHLNIIEDYWNKRADTYAAGVEDELEETAAERWERVLAEHINLSQPNLHVLDVGTGPGFFPLLLARHGCTVDAVDCSPEMLERARQVTAQFANRVSFHLMNAQDLDFPDNTFDAVVTRNLTWTLPDPKATYAEWRRVLKPGGILLNFDANWYTYLIDDKLRVQRMADQADPAVQPDRDASATDEQCARCEIIARTMPLTYAHRPAWDEYALTDEGFSKVVADTDAWLKLWDEKERRFHRTSPMFVVAATK